MAVEVVGLQAEPSGPGDWWKPDGTLKVETPWWTPDGSPLAKAPDGITKRYRSALAGEKIRQVAVRTVGAPADAYYSWQSVPDGSGGGGDDWIAFGDGRTRQHRFSMISPVDRSTLTLRFGIASGEWKVEAQSGGRGSWGIQTRDEAGTPISILFTQAREAPGSASIVVSDTLGTEDQVRVVAIDRDGKVHTPRQATTSWGGSLRQRDQEFGLPLDRIDRFELQRRPYAWAEFPGIALDPRTAAAVPPAPAGR